MINVTDLAVEKLKDVLQEEGQPEGALRILVMPGANGGVQYMLSLEETPSESDQIIDGFGVKLVVDQDSAPFLEGVEIDYTEGLMRSGFTIHNPNFSSGGCACGGSGGCGSNGGGGGCGCGGH